jgi:hypothetical protein
MYYPTTISDKFPQSATFHQARRGIVSEHKTSRIDAQFEQRGNLRREKNVVFFSPPPSHRTDSLFQVQAAMGIINKYWQDRDAGFVNRQNARPSTNHIYSVELFKIRAP